MRGATLIEVLVALSMFSLIGLGSCILSLHGLRLTRGSLLKSQQLINLNIDEITKKE